MTQLANAMAKLNTKKWILATKECHPNRIKAELATTKAKLANTNAELTKAETKVSKVHDQMEELHGLNSGPTENYETWSFHVDLEDIKDHPAKKTTKLSKARKEILQLHQELAKEKAARLDAVQKVEQRRSAAASPLRAILSLLFCGWFQPERFNTIHSFFLVFYSKEPSYSKEFKRTVTHFKKVKDVSHLILMKSTSLWHV